MTQRARARAMESLQKTNGVVQFDDTKIVRIESVPLAPSNYRILSFDPGMAL